MAATQGRRPAAVSAEQAESAVPEARRARTSTAARATAKATPAKSAPAKSAPAKSERPKSDGTSSAKKAPGGVPAKKAASTSTKKTPTTKKSTPAKKSVAAPAPAKKAPVTKTPAAKPTAPRAASQATARKAAAPKAAAESAGQAAAPTNGTKTPATKAAATKTAATKTAATKTPAARTVRDTASAGSTEPGTSGGHDVPSPAGPAVLPGEAPWTDAELADLRSALSVDLHRLREEVRIAEADIADLIRDSGEGAGDDQADAGTKTFEREHEMSLANYARDMVDQVLHAISRLDDGTFGSCESCGNPIGKARLQAFPRASLCLSCKQREERR
ncbi:MAG: TraR/DksA family transcriptional regulator [Actinomycetota bacterium]|nr:MAG: TraR/DksA family transcriptional regulator [Actinomycetota bacterium]